MSDSSPSPDASGANDPWEQLAEDLFGLEFGKEHSSAASEERRSEPPEPAPRTQPEPVAPAPGAEESAPPRFASEAVADSSSPAAPSEVPGDAGPRVVEGPVRPAATTAQDSYWDALANWNWDEKEGASSRSRRRSAEPPSEPAPAPPAGRDEPSVAPAAAEPSPRREREGRREPRRPERRGHESRSHEPRREEPRAAAAADDEFGEFGLGVGNQSPPADSPGVAQSFDDEDLEGDDDDREAEAPGGPAAAGGDEGDGSRKRRRRRRRRRGRGPEDGGPERAPAAAGESAVPGADWDKPAGTAPAPAARVEGTPARVESERDDRRGRRGRRGRGDRRDRGDSGDRHESRRPRDEAEAPRYEEPPVADEVTSSGGDVGIDFEAESDAGDDDTGETIISYDDVPTWEEAISYLLNPSQVQVDGGGGSSAGRSSTPPGDRPRQTRHYGGRKDH